MVRSHPTTEVVGFPTHTIVSNLSKIVVKKDRILEFFKTIIPEFQQINEYTTSKDIIIGGS